MASLYGHTTSREIRGERDTTLEFNIKRLDFEAATWPRVRVFPGSSILGIYLALFVFVTPEVFRPPATASYFLFLSFSCYSLELPFHSTRVSRAFTSSLRIRFFASVPPFPPAPLSPCSMPGLPPAERKSEKTLISSALIKRRRAAENI